jgi:GntR family transcriptional regulator, gluconate operon transcriptional repressor
VVSPISTIRPAALGDQVAQLLREQIISGEIPAETHLVEDQLAEAFDVSRGPVRDALRVLEAEGLVESRRRGVFAVGLTTEDIHDLYALREAVECLALQQAISRADASAWDRGAQMVAEMEKAATSDNHEAFAEADARFHSLLYELSGHRRLAAIWGQYSSVLTTLLRVTVSNDADLATSASDHRRLLELITASDPRAALEEMRSHLHRSRDRMILSYEQSLTQSASSF